MKVPLPTLEGCDGVAGDLGAYQIVWADPTSPAIVNTLIHEGTHVFQHLMKYVGEDEPGLETEAYFIAYIVETLLLEYNRQLKEQNAVHDERKA